jgi:iron complex transport system substrate-binding protein
MRIVSLLPGATEVLFALGLGESVVGVTHECDFPAAARELPRVTRSKLPLDGLDSGGIEAAVAAAAGAGQELYGVDLRRVRELRPDLVVAQDVCAVCAVPADQVELGLPGVRVLRQHPHSLDDVLAGIDELASECGVDAGPLLDGLRARIELVAERAARRPRRRGVFLEWLDPPYRAGHWTPDLLRLAGIDDPLARAGIPSVPVGWQEVADARPELLILAPCGFDRARAGKEAALVEASIRATGATRVSIFDGSAYFNRPGPRLVDSLELLDGAAAAR